LGQFEGYHQIDYWRKLVSIVKSDVTYQTFAFTRTPPREAIRETIALIIDTMAAEETPEAYLDELRALAAGPQGQLLPQARCVVVGTASGQPLNASAGTDYREWLAAEPEPDVRPFVPALISKASLIGNGPASPSGTRVYTSPDAKPEFPAVEPPAAAPPKPSRDAATAPSQIARNAFGLSQAPAPPAPAHPPALTEGDAEDFGLPESAAAPEGFSWEWDAPADPS
ncbi:MAG: hypothetical protein ABSB70_17860, partial [Candidatus Velthaea sp.]